ncbi:MAG: TIGR01777 family oxidoreductase [Acidobacteria bacterium]|nr:TIGR01777 family oxidoreductase [Acidobacteriota bacterium]
MRVLVSGGTGLLGRQLVAELTGAGHECIVLSRHPERVRGLPGGARAERWDGKTTHGWGTLVGEDTALVNLAGASIAGGRWSDARKAEILGSRVAATRAMVQAVKDAPIPPKVLLQASAVGYYGSTGDREIVETSPPGDDFLATVCVAWEAASRPVETLGVRRVLLRTGVVLSRDGGALPKMALPFRLFAGGPVGSGDQYVPWIHEADEIGAMRFLLERDDLAGPFNLTAPEPVTNRELSRRLGAALHRPALVPAPAFALRLLLGEMSGLLLGGQRALPEALAQSGYAFRFASLEAALADLYG